MGEFITTDLILAHVSDMLFVMTVDPKVGFRYSTMNPAAMRASGLNEYAYGATFHDVVIPYEAEILHNQYAQALKLAKPVTFVMNHEGQIGESVLTPIVDSSQEVTHIVATVRDITMRSKTEEQLRRQAHEDALTGLLNRHGFAAGLEQLRVESRRNPSLYSVFVIDVDNLKTINDTYGHIVGDIYLQNIAKRLRQATRAEDLLSRFGGDEFLVLAKVTDALDTRVVAERILQHFKLPWLHEDLELQTSISIGVATYPIDGATLWDVVRAADTALYEAKNMGGQRYTIR